MMPEPKSEDTPQQVDLDLGAALERIDAWLDGAVRLLPNLVVALVVLVVFVLVARLAGRLVRSRAEARDRANLGSVVGGFLKWAIYTLGALLAATIVVPSLNPGDLIAGLGVSSVAIGFAFKDILQNWLAGLLILIRQPFEIGDQIEVGDFEGTVAKIETRATLIKTYDGQRAVIPNSTIYTSPVLVKTAHDKRRSQYDIGVGYGDGVGEAKDVILEAIRGVEGVAPEPAPEVLPYDLAASWVTMRARWWTASRQAEVVAIHARVIRAVKEALDEARIDMPYDTQVHLFHDQSENVDGDRNGQREGWPSPKDGADIRPRAGQQGAAKSETEAPTP